MAEVMGAYAAESAVEGATAAAYGVARSTMPLNARWTPIAPELPLPRSSHSLCVVQGKAYIFGGEIEPRVPVDSDVHVYTLPSGIVESTDYQVIKSTSAPPPRVGHAASAIGKWIYVFGGRGGAEMKPLQEEGAVWSFDTQINEWEKLTPDPGSPHPEARSYHASAATEHPLPSKTKAQKEPASAASDRHGTLFIHGGCPASGRVADVWGFDVAARTWREFPDAPGPPRGGPALACSSKRLFRFGGFDGKAQLGGQMDYLDLGKETFVDQVGVSEAGVIPHPASSQWQSIKFDEPEAKVPGARSVAGMHHVTTGQGRNYLILLLGERNPSDKGHEGAGEFWDDVWTFQLKPDGMTAASFKDATRQLIGMKTKEYDWDEVLIPEATKSKGRAAMPGKRGWFASAAAGDLDQSSVILWGGINEQNQRLGDGFILTLDS